MLYPMLSVHIIWVGNFNRHHPCLDWEEDQHLFMPNALEAAKHLLSTVTDWSMCMVLPPRTPTHKHYISKQKTRLDNVFCTEHTLDLIQHCEVQLDDPKPSTNHYPIVSFFDLQVPHQEVTMKPDYRLVDWSAFNEELSICLSDFPPPAPLATKAEFDSACASLMEAIQDVTRTTVPFKWPCLFTKRWWSMDLHKLRQSMHRLY